jgi:hypothetical protein
MSDESEGWKESAIAWSLCASIHRQHAKGTDPFFESRLADFMRSEKVARAKYHTHEQRGKPRRDEPAVAEH